MRWQVTPTEQTAAATERAGTTENQDMNLDKTIKYAGIAIAGGAVGAAIGLLMAPASGEETRRRITERIDSEKDEFLRRLRRDPRTEEGYPYSVISA
jgi:hypothetical protein